MNPTLNIQYKIILFQPSSRQNGIGTLGKLLEGYLFNGKIARIIAISINQKI
jgi:hypothetical protein